MLPYPDVEPTGDAAADPDAVPGEFHDDAGPDIFKKYSIGDRINVPNGITVEVVDTFPTEDNMMICLDYYIGEEKISDSPACLKPRDPVEFFDGQTYPRFFSDYGVTVTFEGPFDSMPSMSFAQDTGGYIRSPKDLFYECMNSGHSLQGCLRYVPRDALDGETVLKENPFITFVAGGNDPWGGYYRDQQTLCSKKASEVMPGAGPLDEGSSLRYILEDKPAYGNTRWGRAYGSSYVAIFSNVNTQGSAEEGLDKYGAAFFQSGCYDGAVLHELGHTRMMHESGLFTFWHPLNEGLMRFIEIEYPMHPGPEVFADKELGNGESFELTYDLGDGYVEVTTFTVKSISDNEVVVGIKAELPGMYEDELGEAKVAYGVVSYLPVAVLDYKNYAFLANVHGSGADKKVNISLVVLHNLPFMEMHLNCKDKAYDSEFGTWHKGEFYENPEVVGELTGKDLPYRPLDGSVSTTKLYDSGACFYYGVKKMYDESGKDFGSFIEQLHFSFADYAEKSRVERYADPICILGTMQNILDTEELDTPTFDIKKYAANRFSYDEDKKPWCGSIDYYDFKDTYKGFDQFGKIESFIP